MTQMNLPGAGCATCEHAERDTINALINARATGSGPSNRAIARKYNLGKDSVSRHVWKRHPGVLLEGAADALPGEEEERGDMSLRERLVEQRGWLESEMRARPRSDLSRELRQVNREIDEIDGANKVKEVSVEDVQGLPEQVARWFEALEPYPDARAAMLAATDKKLLEKVPDATSA